MAISLITDIIWIIYWAVTWNSYDNKELGVCIFTIIVSVLEFLVKVVTVIITFVKEPECNSAIKDLPHNLKTMMTPPSN